MAPHDECAGTLGAAAAPSSTQAAGTSAAKLTTPHSSPQRGGTTDERGEPAVEVPAPATPSPGTRKKRAYFQVDFQDKEEAKAMGARWDGDMKQWYAASDTVAQRLAARFTAAAPASARKFFSVSFEDKDRAKLMGGRWDAKLKLWYALLAHHCMCSPWHALHRFQLCVCSTS